MAGVPWFERVAVCIRLKFNCLLSGEPTTYTCTMYMRYTRTNYNMYMYMYIHVYSCTVHVRYIHMYMYYPRQLKNNCLGIWFVLLCFVFHKCLNLTEQQTSQQQSLDIYVDKTVSSFQQGTCTPLGLYTCTCTYVHH